MQEIRRAQQVTPRYTLGVLGPPAAHRLANRGINTRLFYCNGDTILPQAEGAHLAPECEHHSTFSMYKIGAYVYALDGDVLQQTGSLGPSEYHDPADTEPQDHWQHITFAHRPGRRSSYVGFGFNQGQLAARRQNAAWVQSLIPRAYQSEMLATDAEAGGLDGELAIILGLMRFCEEPRLSQFTSYCVMQNGTWWMLPPPTPSPTRRKCAIQLKPPSSKLTPPSTNRAWDRGPCLDMPRPINVARSSGL